MPMAMAPTAGRVASKVAIAGCDEPVKANIGDVGYFRVSYAPEAAKTLVANFKRFPPADRVNLLSDAWAMVQAGRAQPDRGYPGARRPRGEDADAPRG